jgi:hypothetical protein
MERIRLVLDPKLGLEPGELAAAWNAEPALVAQATATRGEAEAGSFLDPMLAQGLVTLAVSVTASITSGLVLEFVKARLQAKGKTVPVVVEQRELPSGERVLITHVGDG